MTLVGVFAMLLYWWGCWVDVVVVVLCCDWCFTLFVDLIVVVFGLVLRCVGCLSIIWFV